jgi:periplasmic protein TonB
MLRSLWMGDPADRPDGSGFTPDRRGRAWILTTSVLVHGAVLATLAGVQLWRVEAVAEPAVADVFQVQLPLPPLPAPPQEHATRQADTPPHQTAGQPPAAPPLRPAAVPPNLATIPERVPPPSFVPLPPDPPPAATSGDRSGRDAIGGRSGDRGDPGGKDGSRYGDGPLPIGGPISRPEVVPGTKVQPRYTEAARIAHVQGVVVLQAVIDARGNVIDARIVKDLPLGLGDEAVKAVSMWKFTPALLAGVPVKVYFELTVQFQVR